MLRDATIQRLKERIGDAQYCGTFDCAYPVYDCELELRMLALEKLSAIEEYVLRSISLGVGTLSGVDLVLGLGLAATRRAVAELLGADLVEEDWSSDGESRYQISEPGKEALDKIAVKKTIVLPLQCVVDGVTGEVSVKPTRARYLGPEKLIDLGVIVLPAQQDPPAVDAFDVTNLNALVRNVARAERDRLPQGEVLDLQRVTRTQRRYRRIDVVVFRSREKGLIVRVFERHAEQRGLAPVLSDLLRSDPTLLPLDGGADSANDSIDDDLLFLPPDLRQKAREGADRVLVLEEQIADVESKVDAARNQTAPQEATTREQLAELEGRFAALREEHAMLETQLEQGVKRVETSEHRALLERAFKHAREQIIIVSPWLSRDAIVGSLEGWLREAVVRGVWVRIGWGFSDETRDQLKERASKEMVDYLESAVADEARNRGPLKGALQVVRLGNSHEKILIADSNFCVVTSFNWLSFRGDPKRKHRRETGARIGVPAQVATWRQDFEQVLTSAAASNEERLARS